MSGRLYMRSRSLPIVFLDSRRRWASLACAKRQNVGEIDFYMGLRYEIEGQECGGCK